MASENVVELSQSNFEEIALSADKPALVDFWAAWCGPCRAVAPSIDRLSNEYSGKLSVCKLDVDKQKDLAIRYGITNIPTVMLFKGGAVVETIVGARQYQDYKDAVDRHV